MGGDVDVPALLTQEAQIADGRFRAGQQHQIRHRNRLTRLHDPQVDRGLVTERVEIVEIRDPGETGHRDHHRGVGIRCLRRTVQCHRILRRQTSGLGEPGHHPEAGPAGPLGDLPQAVVEQRDVAPEPVDQKTYHVCPISVRQNRVGPDHRRDHPAPVDVADQHHRTAGRLGKPHIGDVAGPQIDLRRTASALDQQQIRVLRQPRRTFQHRRQQFGLQSLIFPRTGVADPFAVDHHLGADIGLRLQQYRIQIDHRIDSGGPRLQRLGPADLTAIDRDGGVVRHVLRLERPHLQAPPGEQTTQARHDQRLADIRAGALEHERPRRHGG